MVTTKRLVDLAVGDVVHDMHDGLAGLRARFDVREVVRWRHEPDRTTFHLPKLNKYLYVLGHTDSGEVVCGYSYDGRMSAVLLLTPKGAQ